MFTQIANNGRLVALLIALLVIVGTAALQVLPRMEDPRTETRAALIQTPYPGANALRVEALVTRTIEDELRELPEIENIRSNSRAGLSTVTVLLYGSVIDSAPVMAEIRDKLNDLTPSLPHSAGAPRFRELNVFAHTIITAIEWQGQGAPRTALLGRYAKELQSRLLGIPGTEKTEIIGAPKEEILVSLDIPKADALGLTVERVAAHIAQADAKVAAGELISDHFKWQLEVRGELDSLERIRSIPLQRGSANEVVRLGDIAEVKRSQKLPEAEIAVIDGQKAIFLGAMTREDIRIEPWRQAAGRELADFNAEMPREVKARILFDQQNYTDKRLAELLGNIAIGFAVVLMVLVFTLGWRSAFIVAASLPLTLCFTLFCLQLKGIEIHQISVVGLVVSLGILVDNAIVMSDAIAQERRAGKPVYEAIRASIAHFWLPLLGSTLTTVLAFSPIAIMPGNAGEFVGPLAWSVIFSLLGSFLVAHTIVAGLSGRFLTKASTNSRAWWERGVVWPSAQKKFTSSILWCLRHPVTTLLIVMLLSASGLLGATRMSVSFFPPADRDMFQVALFMPPGTGIHTTLSVTEELSADIKAMPGIESVDWVVGNSAPKFYYNLLAGNDGMGYYAQAMIKAIDYRAADAAIKRLQRDTPRDYTEALVLTAKLEQGPPYNAPIELRLVGENLDTLRSLGRDIWRIVSQQPHVLGIRSSLENAQPKLWVNLDEDRMAQSGATLTEASAQLQAALTGRLSGSIIEGTEELPVRIRVNDRERADISRVESGYLVLHDEATFNAIPFSALGDSAFVPEPSNVARYNGRRVNTIQVYPEVGVLSETVLQAILSGLDAADFSLPDGYRLELGGEADASGDATGDLMAYINVIVILLVLVIALTFNSFRMTAMVFSVAIAASGFGLLSVYLSGYSLGFIIIVACLGLMGLAINAAIVIMAELRISQPACEGDEQSILNSVMVCSRHIVSTTLTTAGGFLPLLFDSGTFWPPFAITIIGGTLLTTMVSFYFVPALFLLMARQRNFEVTTGIEAHSLSTDTTEQPSPL